MIFDLSYGMKIWTYLSSVLSQCMHWQTDGGTNGQTEFSLLDCICIPCSMIKMMDMLPERMHY